MRRVDLVLLFASALLAGSAAVAALWPAALLALATMALLRRRATAFVLAAGFVMGGLRAEHAVRTFEAERLHVRPPSNGLERCDVFGVVSSSPVMVRGTPRFDLTVTRSDCAAGLAGRVTLYGGLTDVTGKRSELGRGDSVHATVQLGALDRFVDPELGSAEVRETRRGVLRTGSVVDAVRLRSSRSVLAMIDHARAHVRTRIEATFPESTAGLARALVLGEADLDPVDDDAFRASGLAHLLAVSGMHLVLVVVGAVAALRACLVRVTVLSERVDVGRVAAAFGVPFCWAYADFAGGSGSALRASWMLTAALCARAFSRRTTAVRTLALSLLGALALDPLALFDVSFSLSACATAGLIAFSRPLGAAFVARAPACLHGLLKQAAVTFAATIPCAPVLATFAPSLPLASVVANLVAVPLGEAAALPLCLLHALLAPFPSAEGGCAVAASGALWGVRGIARAFAGLHVLQLPVPAPSNWQLAVIAFAFAAVVWSRRRATLVAGALVVLVLLELPVRMHGAPRGVLRATFIDIGQGDSALVDLPDGSAMLIDGGGIVGSPLDVGRRVLAPLFRARRLERLALVVLTHPHPDHFGGLDAGLADVSVGELWDTGQGERESVGGVYASVLGRALAQGTHVRRPPDLCGSHVIGGARVDVLAPCPDASSDRPPNDNSFVLRVAYGKRAFLFEGDAEREEEAELVRRFGGQLKADVLKVGHHGSRTSSTPALLEAVSPELAVISCGVRNRYGHPYPTTLSGLEAARARVLRTDRSGAITVTTDGSALLVDEAVEAP